MSWLVLFVFIVVALLSIASPEKSIFCLESAWSAEQMAGGPSIDEEIGIGRLANSGAHWRQSLGKLRGR